MLCPECGTYASDESIVCPRCGKLLERTQVEVEEAELMQFRQGRHLQQTKAPVQETERPAHSGSRSFEDTRPPQTPENTDAAFAQSEMLSGAGMYYGYDKEDDRMETDKYAVPTIMQENIRRSRVKRHISHKRVINWAYVLIAVFVLVIIAAIGTFLYLTKTENGQVILARAGYDATAEAMWRVGEEKYNSGDVEKAIDYFLIAREKDEEAEKNNSTGLLMLGEAYEAVGDLAAAEEVYRHVYTDIVPSDPEAYRAQVRVLKEQERNAEAADLLQLAYENTKLTIFRSERAEILPSIPTVNVLPGYHTEKKTIVISQAQDYSVYYTLDIYAELPEGGILYEEPIELGEGDHELRAVAVVPAETGDLVSDEMEVAYQIYMPTPLAPDANLAPGTYSSRRKVTLKPGKLSDEQLEKNPGYAATLEDEVAQTITIYYTIDGSMPDADSPIYTGEPIVMETNGYNTLRAVSVNGYDKQGNMKEVTIKLNLKTKSPKVYNLEDVITGLSGLDLKVAVTTREAFLNKYGEGTSTEMVYIYGIDGECERHHYSWGYASFMHTKTGWTLAEMYLTNNELKAPRGTQIGMTEKEITSKFKDFGQVTSPSGNRGLYEDENDKGKIYMQENGGKIIRYRTGTEDVHIWQLDYNLDESGKVKTIHWLYEP